MSIGVTILKGEDFVGLFIRPQSWKVHLQVVKEEVVHFQSMLLVSCELVHCQSRPNLRHNMADVPSDQCWVTYCLHSALVWALLRHFMQTCTKLQFATELRHCPSFHLLQASLHLPPPPVAPL